MTEYEHPKRESGTSLRRKVEEILRTTRQDVAALPVGDVQELIHELQVHQIELEMQNDALRDAQQELEESREQYRQLYDHAPMGYLTVDRGGIIREANLMAGLLFGIGRDRMTGMQVADFLSPRCRDNFAAHKQNAFRSGVRQVCQVTTACEDAVALQVTSHTDRNNQLCRITLADVTLMKRLEKRLTTAQTAAQNANDAKTQFLAVMSHEIRTPLNAVVGISDLLSRSTLNAKQTQFVATLQTSATALLGLVNEILDFSRVESGNLELEYRPFDLRKLVAETVAINAGRTMRAREIAVEIEPELPPYLLGDSLRLKQVLVNLVSNAVKFAPDGDIIVRAAGSYAGAHGFNLKLEVIDTGIGIPDSKRERIFDAFTQADASTARQFGGSGLGLAICQRLVNAMGGEIGVCSQLGEGSVFTVRVTLDCCDAPPDIQPVTVENCLLDRNGARHRILLVEDNPANILVAKAYLDEYGIDYDVCRTGKDALAQLSAHIYSAVLLDVQMPEMDGFETALRIRAIENARGMPRMPIIAMTAHVLPKDRERCHEHGMDAHVSKPIDPAELLARLTEQLERR